MKENIHITRNNTLTGEFSPKGLVVPKYIGQQFIDTLNDRIYTAKGLDADSWIEASGGSSDINLEPTINDVFVTSNGVKKFECNNNFIDNIHIEGKTLVNLASHNKGIYSLIEASGNIWTNNEEGLGTYTEKDGIISYTSGTEAWTDFGSLIPVKEGSKIRFITNILESGEAQINCVAAFFKDIPKFNESNANEQKRIEVQKIELTGDLELQDHQFTVPAEAKYALFTLAFSNANTTYEFRYMLLENNEDEYVGFFNGVRSVGQDTGINLLTKNNSFNDFTFTGDLFEYGTINASLIPCPLEEALSDSKKRFRLKDSLPVEQNTSYTVFVDNKDMDIAVWYIKDGILVKDSGWLEKNLALIDTLDCDSIRFVVRPKHNNIIANKDEIFKRNTIIFGKTKDILNTFDTATINTTLRGLPNGVKDSIFKEKDKYYKIERLKEVVFSGEQNISYFNDTVMEDFVQVNLYVPEKTTRRNFNSLVSDFSSSFGNMTDRDNILLDIDSGEVVALRIAKNKLNEVSEAGVIEYLKTNPVTVVYELENFKVIELPNIKLETFANETEFFVDCGQVLTEASFEVTTSFANDINSIREEVNTLSDQNAKLSNKVDEVLKDLKAQNIMKTENVLHFEDLSISRNLDDITYNLTTQVAKANSLKNLPFNENGGGGLLEVVQVFKKNLVIGTLSHTIQRYTNTSTGMTYIRQYNFDSKLWTPWAMIYDSNNKYSHGSMVGIPATFYDNCATDLDTIKENMTTWTWTKAALVNLPPGENGGAGFFRCISAYKKSGSQCHAVQEFLNTTTNRRYCRTYNVDNAKWTAWEKPLRNADGTIPATHNADFDTITETGWHYITGPTNGPLGTAGAWFLEVITRSGGYTYQRAIRNLGGDDTLEKYERTMYNNTWTAWRSL